MRTDKLEIGLVAVCALLTSCGVTIKPQEVKAKMLTARAYNSGFADAHDTYNGMGTGSDGRIYYVLSSDKHDVAAQMYSFDPATEQIRHLGDLTEACGEKGKSQVSQGKSHVTFVEANKKLYFATHIGYYSIIDGMEKPGIPPSGYKPYAGGHFLAYDIASGKFEDLGIAPKGEGIITFNMDTVRARLFGITWPTGHFIRYDIPRKEMKDLGPFFEQGENGRGQTYRTICRSLAVDPDVGNVYFSRGEGTIFRYRYDKDAVEIVRGDDLKKDYFGQYDVNSAGHMAYNWRQVVWYAPERSVYGVHGNSGYLFRFVPEVERVDVLRRITSEPSQLSGMFDQFSYGYLGFALGPDGKTLNYLTGGPVYVNGRRVRGKDATAKGESRGEENLHLVTYDIPSGKYTDHGAIYLENGQRPAYVNAIALGRDGTVYTLSRVREGARTRTDLIRIISGKGR